MIIRSSYVSNSSSTDYLVIYDDIAVFEFIKEVEDCSPLTKGLKGYEQFMHDLKGGSSSKAEVLDFLIDKYNEILDGFAWNLGLNSRGFSLFVRNDHANPIKDFIELCDKLGCGDDEGIRRAYTEAVQNMELDAGQYRDPSSCFTGGCSSLAESFARMVYEKIKRKHVKVVGYSDEDGDFYCYMEHDFMKKLEASDEDGFAVFGVSRH